MSAPPRTLGPFEIVRRLGGGGMGETFLAVKRGPAGFEQRVCLKRVLPDHEGDETFVRYFLEEAKIAATLRHSNIVGIVDFGAADGVYYMALELIDGTDLGQILRRAPGRRLPPPLVALIGADLAHALEYAHGRTRAGEASGVLHRDLSASNVLVSYAGEVKLSDFGLAKVMSAGNATASGAVRGKVPYMSPEQVKAERMDGRSDLFSLGIVLHEALTGRRPFDGDSIGDTMAKILNGRRPLLAELAPAAPPALTDVLDRLLELKPDDRYPSPAALVDALELLAPGPSARRDLGGIAERARPKQTIGLPPIEAAQPPAATAGPSLQASPLLSRLRPIVRGAGLGLVIAAIAGAGILGYRHWTAPANQASISSPAPVVPLSSPGPGDAARESPPPQRLASDSATEAPLSTATVPSTVPSPAPLSPATVPSTVPSPTPLSPATVPSTVPSPPPTVPPAVPAPAPPSPTTVPPAVPAPPPPSPTTVPPAVPAPAPTVPADAATRPPPNASPNTAERATVTVAAIPWGKVWVDGRLVGNAPARVVVAPGTHSIAVGAGDSPTKRTTIRVAPGERRSVTLRVR